MAAMSVLAIAAFHTGSVHSGASCCGCGFRPLTQGRRPSIKALSITGLTDLAAGPTTHLIEDGNALAGIWQWGVGEG